MNSAQNLKKLLLFNNLEVVFPVRAVEKLILGLEKEREIMFMYLLLLIFSFDFLFSPLAIKNKSFIFKTNKY